MRGEQVLFGFYAAFIHISRKLNIRPVVKNPCGASLKNRKRITVAFPHTTNPRYLTGSGGSHTLTYPASRQPPSYSSHRPLTYRPAPDTRTDKTQHGCRTRRSLPPPADERPGKEPAVALQHIVIGQYRSIQQDRDLGERHAIEAVFIAVGLLADLGPEPDVFDAVRHLDGVIFQVRRVFSAVIFANFYDLAVNFIRVRNTKLQWRSL